MKEHSPQAIRPLKKEALAIPAMEGRTYEVISRI
jgi:hypothetical protein